MSSYKNNVHLEGNLGKDAEKKSTPNGDVVNFSITVNEQWEDKDGAEHKNTDWFQIQVWGFIGYPFDFSFTMQMRGKLEIGIRK